VDHLTKARPDWARRIEDEFSWAADAPPVDWQPPDWKTRLRKWLLSFPVAGRWLLACARRVYAVWRWLRPADGATAR
jgi:hypothetical protein